ncbi:hypothetical protein AsFcp4_126 [Aeromonas phage AsFcp_4]|uniref:Uncharacterized protein n=1 Tax=Aeromonas phage PX29 TaxID=926067 RepID=E5DQM8_9CAUD|nr:hypothetical protein CL89_gp183 [Aeromonas phage PX29]ADQ53014.1 conserved hypothetical protein [Aeromonas phage PX29]QAX98550.1 hypothetical protein ASfcp2_215 [Aeromonas phage AsFcp_2]QAX99580.1 hypothetical protein AsFcp4_126 [Aeromonas phage AsFcp_4]
MIPASKARENLKFDRALRMREAINNVSKKIESASVQGKRVVYVYDVGADIRKQVVDEITKHGYEVEFTTEFDYRSTTGDYLKISW